MILCDLTRRAIAASERLVIRVEAHASSTVDGVNVTADLAGVDNGIDTANTRLRAARHAPESLRGAEEGERGGRGGRLRPHANRVGVSEAEER